MCLSTDLLGRRPRALRGAAPMAWTLWWLLVVAALLMLPPAARAGGAAVPPSLALDEAVPSVDAWRAVRLLADPEGTLTVDDAIARTDFVAADGPHANLGIRRGAVWLRVALEVDAHDDGRWVANIDYPSLDRIDLFVVVDGRVAQRALLGDQIVFRDRALPARSHAAPLRLVPGTSPELLLRVQTRSSMIVPLTLHKAAAFHAAELPVQLVQGLAMGIALCLVFYSLAQWPGGRDPMYLYYALTVSGLGLFFFAYYGLAPQYLWPGHAWLTDNAAPAFVLWGIGGALLLVERLLDVRDDNPRLARVMQGLAVVAFAVSVAFAAGLVGYRVAHLAGTVLGPMPVLLGLHLVVPRALRGDRASHILLFGWAAYAAGVLTMAALLRGWLPSNPWTQNAFQVGWLCESLAWLRVLGLRTEAAQRAAERAARESEVLQALANTDALTGLPNRRGLDARLRADLAQLAPGDGLAVYLIDLDGFKGVNDRHGHDAGDDLLRQASRRLRGLLRSHDVVARLGGDEFVVVAGRLTGEADAWRLGQKMVDAFREPFVVNGQACAVGLTTGFALAPNDGCAASDLLKRADAAMYAGKASGKGRVQRGGASVGLAGG